MTQDRQRLTHGFGPFYRADSHLLILGSFPSVKSRESSFYYGHPQNRFWRILAAVCGSDVPVSREEKEAFLTAQRIALYDVIESCTIIGSADSTISDVVVSDLRPLLENSRINDHIFINGSKAYELYSRYSYPLLGIRAEKLPSSSPANAAWTLPRLTEEWRRQLCPILRECPERERGNTSPGLKEADTDGGKHYE